jgi:hypothetical protein
VIFGSENSDIKLLETKIKELIFSIYSFEVDIFITTLSQPKIFVIEKFEVINNILYFTFQTDSKNQNQ